MMAEANSAARSRVDLFMKTFLVQEGSECKDILGGNPVGNVGVNGQSAGLRRGTGSLPLFGESSEFLHDLAGAYCKRKELIMPGKCLFQGCAVIDDYVVITEVGFGKMAAIRPAVNHDLITVAMKLNV